MDLMALYMPKVPKLVILLNKPPMLKTAMSQRELMMGKVCYGLIIISEELFADVLPQPIDSPTSSLRA